MAEVKIGLETHLQLLSESKLFCGCPTSGRDEPNTNVCPTCLGMPGAKPRINKKVIEMGMKIAEALNCKMPEEMNFSRKTYFYPDMPKNFQITQFAIPLGRNGELTLELDGEERTVRIKRIHLEEDPGKLKHIGGGITSADYVLMDYNRSGVPLCEIVTEPDLRSPEEARVFLRKLVEVFEYLEVYDSSSEASLRSDANISTFGERAEVKNISGFSGVEKALRYEMKRQENLRKRGKEMKRETRAYDEESGVTKKLRKKEFEEEYGYIFEPDLTSIELKDDWVERLVENLPELPHEKKERYVEEYGMSEEVAAAICSDFDLAMAFEDIASKTDEEVAYNLLSGPVKKVLNYHEFRFAESELDTSKVLKVAEMLESGEITERNAEMIVRELVKEDKGPVKVKEEKGFGKASSAEVEELVEKVIEENKAAVKDYKKGKDKALNHLMGQLMEKSGGKADPKEARKFLRKRIES
ncbi:MAG: Asp-tRNA(Asn)/Glu-tRNA(Gln) amidotransferase subunit GatB [Candidatus Aenigmatarchaeota archaeon]